MPMQCPNPIRLKGNIDVPCGICEICLSNKRAEWTIRIEKELKNSASGWFVTLTYDDDNLPLMEDTLYQTLCKKDLQLFLKRLRKYNTKMIQEYNKGLKVSERPLKMIPVRFYAVGEYGSKTYRPHYHVILFNVNSKTKDKIIDIWKLGNCHIGTLTSKSIHYVTKYMINRHDYHHGVTKPFTTMSRRPGIGAAYMTDQLRNWHEKYENDYIVKDGYKYKLPRYYQERMNIYRNDSRKEIVKTSVRAKQLIERIKEDDRLRSQGIDPFKYSLDQIELKKKQIKKSSKTKL